MNIELLRVAGDISAHLVPLGANLFLQSSLLIATGLLVAHLCGRRGPALQSTILRATLVALITCPVASLLFGLAGVEGSRLSLPHPGALATSAEVRATSLPAALTPSSSATATATLPAAPSVATVAVAAKPTGASPLPVTSGSGTMSPQAAAAPASAPRDEWSALALVYAAFAGLWLVGAGFFLTRLAICHQRIARMRRESDLPEVAVFESCGGIARELAIPSPEIRLHRELKSPLLVGLFHPAILLPDVKDLASLVASREVLVHELAHRVRGDCFWHLLSHVTTALLWFQPLLWMLTRRIEESGEEVCDNYVIARAPDRQAYAHQLVQLADHLQYSATEALAGTGVIAFRSALGRRVVRILDASRNLSLRIGTRAATSIAVGAVLATSAVGLIGVALRAESEIGPRLTVRRLLADASDVGDNLTAHGKLIRGLKIDTGDVVQFDVATGQESRIKNTGPWSEQDWVSSFQVFSRDGEQIAYDSSSKDRVPQFQVRNLDGSNVRTLYSEKGTFLRALDWSPDAGSILASRSGPEMLELIQLSTADGSVRVLKSIPKLWVWLNGASFSPDGRYIAYSHKREGSPLHGDIFLMTAEGRDEVVVAGHPAEDRLEGWSPDGSRLIFSSDRSGTWDLWAIAITEGKPQGKPTLLKRDFGSGSEVLGFTFDGSCYYATGTRLGGLYHGEIDLASGKILVPPVSVTLRYTGLPAKPSWSPNGARLQYVSNRGAIGPGNNILTIRTADMSGERFLSPRLHFLNQVSWGPDGRSLVAIGMSDTGGGIFRIDAETSEVTQLAGESRYSPNLCPDGKTLVFVRPGLIITKRNLDTGEQSDVIKATYMLYDLSPDGRNVVFQVDGAVKIVPLNGGEPRELCRGLAKTYRLSWTQDGRYIIVQSFGGGNKNAIWCVPAQGGTPLKLELTLPKWSYFALHPDNRRFVYSIEEENKRELWVLENFLPAARLAGSR